jgi:hypothetical protein
MMKSNCAQEGRRIFHPSMLIRRRMICTGLEENRSTGRDEAGLVITAQDGTAQDETEQDEPVVSSSELESAQTPSTLCALFLEDFDVQGVLARCLRRQLIAERGQMDARQERFARAE